jgi:hypothetical protein
MILLSPSYGVRLLAVPCFLNEQQQLYFSDIDRQTEYFRKLEHFDIDNPVFIPEAGELIVTQSYANLYNYNMAVYYNEVNEKWVYASFEPFYFQDKKTRLVLKIDLFQTYMHDLDLPLSTLCYGKSSITLHADTLYNVRIPRKHCEELIAMLKAGVKVWNDPDKFGVIK